MSLIIIKLKFYNYQSKNPKAVTTKIGKTDVVLPRKSKRDHSKVEFLRQPEKSSSNTVQKKITKGVQKGGIAVGATTVRPPPPQRSSIGQARNGGNTREDFQGASGSRREVPMEEASFCDII